jgi:uncharacterized protein
MIGKIHKYAGQKIFACCDFELLEKNILFNDVKIHISSGFYGSTKLTKKEILDFVSEANQVNVFGKRVCDLLLSKNIITKEDVIYIENIPHIQIYKI